MFIVTGSFLGSNGLTRTLTHFAFDFQNPILEQQILGINFKNPIGLAAGFDKNARLLSILPEVGFGFAEVGSITGEKCDGNPKPRLKRLKKSKGLLVNYGLVNDGCEAVSKRLTGKKLKIPFGVNIAKTNCALTADTQEGIKDYLKVFKVMSDIGDYCVLNISCPNAFGGQPFTTPDKLEALLKIIFNEPKCKPVFLKLSPDLSLDEVDELIRVIDKFQIDGIIISNLTKDRNNNSIQDSNIPENGGMSGKIVEKLSDDMIAHVYQKTKGRYVIIGCGGVFSAEDAYKKIKLGSSLIQLITGMIFEGPQLIGEINSGLVKLLKNEGYKSISEAVGKASN